MKALAVALAMAGLVGMTKAMPDEGDYIVKVTVSGMS